ncbi:MAG: peptide chain release factor-like protein [Candidatus Omnitrophota bacterium]|nr:peptide chain release factor-like protein [Candidatus Omnitrophota bacterium]
MFSVSIEKEKELFARMRSLGVREEDIEEKFIRSSGPGGQNVNKTSTCVYLRHISTGIEVKCQQERAQSLNRYLGRRRLLDLIEERKNGFIAAQRKLIEKIRRQKKRRSRRAKEKILQNKRLHSEKKKMRVRIRGME